MGKLVYQQDMSRCYVCCLCHLFLRIQLNKQMLYKLFYRFRLTLTIFMKLIHYSNPRQYVLDVIRVKLMCSRCVQTLIFRKEISFIL